MVPQQTQYFPTLSPRMLMTLVRGIPPAPRADEPGGADGHTSPELWRSAQSGRSSLLQPGEGRSSVVRYKPLPKVGREVESVTSMGGVVSRCRIFGAVLGAEAKVHAIPAAPGRRSPVSGLPHTHDELGAGGVGGVLVGMKRDIFWRAQQQPWTELGSRCWAGKGPKLGPPHPAMIRVALTPPTSAIQLSLWAVVGKLLEATARMGTG